MVMAESEVFDRERASPLDGHRQMLLLDDPGEIAEGDWLRDLGTFRRVRVVEHLAPRPDRVRVDVRGPFRVSARGAGLAPGRHRAHQGHRVAGPGRAIGPPPQLDHRLAAGVSPRSDLVISTSRGVDTVGLSRVLRFGCPRRGRLHHQRIRCHRG